MNGYEVTMTPCWILPEHYCSKVQITDALIGTGTIVGQKLIRILLAVDNCESYRQDDQDIFYRAFLKANSDNASISHASSWDNFQHLLTSVYNGICLSSVS